MSWAKANYMLLGVTSAEDAAAAILRAAVEDVLAVYWNREVARFKSMRCQLLALWPQGEAVPQELLRVLPPPFPLRLKDFFDAWWPARHTNGRLSIAQGRQTCDVAKSDGGTPGDPHSDRARQTSAH
jgi:hypothetical protein